MSLSLGRTCLCWYFIEHCYMVNYLNYGEEKTAGTPYAAVIETAYCSSRCHAADLL